MKLEDQLRGAIRLKQYSMKTEDSYVGWYRRYVKWHGMRHPAEMGAAEVEAFLTHLAVNRRVAARPPTGLSIPLLRLGCDAESGAQCADLPL